jgi:hypothetical protein
MEHSIQLDGCNFRGLISAALCLALFEIGVSAGSSMLQRKHGAMWGAFFEAARVLISFRLLQNIAHAAKVRINL